MECVKCGVEKPLLEFQQVRQNIYNQDDHTRSTIIRQIYYKNPELRSQSVGTINLCAECYGKIYRGVTTFHAIIKRASRRNTLCLIPLIVLFIIMSIIFLVQFPK